MVVSLADISTLLLVIPLGRRFFRSNLAVTRLPWLWPPGVVSPGAKFLVRWPLDPVPLDRLTEIPNQVTSSLKSWGELLEQDWYMETIYTPSISSRGAVRFVLKRQLIYSQPMQCVIVFRDIKKSQ